MTNNKIKKSLFFLAILLQVLFLISMVATKQISILRGRKIIAKVIPIDPRSLFRGDYIVLNFSFSQINLREVESNKNYFRKGQKVYVLIEEYGDDWKAVYVSDEPIEDISKEEVVLRGTVDKMIWGNSIQMVYGIENYFVPEDKGKEIEHNIFRKKVKAELSINKTGYASVTKILIDEKEVIF